MVKEVSSTSTVRSTKGTTLTTRPSTLMTRMLGWLLAWYTSG